MNAFKTIISAALSHEHIYLSLEGKLHSTCNVKVGCEHFAGSAKHKVLEW